MTRWLWPRTAVSRVGSSRAAASYFAASFFAVPFFAASFFAASPAHAQAPPPGADEDADVRLSRTVALTERDAPVHVEIAAEDDGDQRIWSLTATLARGDAPGTTRLCQTTVAAGMAAEHHDYTIVTRPVGPRQHVMLIEAHARPERGAPPDSSTYQVALLFEPTSRAGQRWACQPIARGEFNALDGGTQLRFDTSVEPTQLLRTQASEIQRMCGASTNEHQLLESYDPARRRFTVRTPVEGLLEGASPLAATLPTERFQPTFLTGYYAWSWASSDARNRPGSSATVRPLALGDLDLTTAWIEGNEGSARGEYATAGINSVLATRGFRIFAGHGASERLYRQHARPTRVLVLLSDGSRYLVELGTHDFATMRERGGLLVEFPQAVVTTCMTVLIVDAEPGAPSGRGTPDMRNAAAIAEISPISELDAPTATEVAIRLVEHVAAEPNARRRERLAQMTGLIEHELMAPIRQVIVEGPEERRTRVIPLLGQLPTDLALPVLVAAYEAVDIDDPEYRTIKRALAGHDTAAADFLVELLDRLDPASKKYVDTIRLIGRVGRLPHHVRLIEDLGEGERFVRNERIRAIGNGELELAATLAARAHAEPDTPAAFDALRALNILGRRHYHRMGARQVEGSERLLEVVRASRRRAHLLQAIGAMSYFRSDGAADLLANDLLATHPDPLVRAAAAAALERFPDPAARQALERALSDPSPDVRIAAIGALAGRQDAVHARDAVIAYAELERWTQGLYHAFNLLAGIDDARTRAFFEDVVATAIDADQGIIALRALKRADRTLPVPLVERLLRSRSTPLAARRQLLDLLGLDRSAEGEALLLEVAGGDAALTGQESPEVEEILMRHAMLALGLRRSPRAVDLFFAILDEPTLLDRKQVALRALAFYASRDVLTRLEAWAPQAPEELEPELRDALRMIENRISMRDASEDLDELMDAIDEQR